MTTKIIYLVILLSLLVACKNKENGKGNEITMRDKLCPQIVNAYEKGEWECIVILVDSLINSGEVYDDLVLIYAKALQATGNPQKAIQVLKDDLANSDSHTKRYYAYNQLGDVYLMQKDYDSAISAYVEAIKLQPSYARPMMNLGWLYFEIGDTAKAVHYYVEAAVLFNDNNMPDELMAIGKRLVEDAPNNYLSWKVMGDAFDSVEDYDGEEECLKHEMELLLGGKDFIVGANREQFVLAMMQLANVQYKLEKYDECLSSIEWLRNSTTSLGDWEDEIARLYEAAMEKRNMRE